MEAPPTVTAVLFDLDETLLDRTRSLHGFLSDQHARFAASLGNVDVTTWGERFLALDARGSVPKARVYPALLAEFGGDAGSARALLDDFADNCCRHALPVPGMAEVLETLRRRGLPLGVVTNGETTFQGRHIAALGLSDLVDTVLVSETEGVRKPDPAIFRRAAERLEVTPGGCVFVGDNPRADVLGAAAAGMHPVWFRRGLSWPDDLPPNPGRAIDELPGLLALIT